MVPFSTVTVAPSGASASGGGVVPGRRSGTSGGAPANTMMPSGVCVPSGVARMKPLSSRGSTVPGGGGSAGVGMRISVSAADRSGSPPGAGLRATVVRSGCTTSGVASTRGITGIRGARCQTPVAA